MADVAGRAVDSAMTAEETRGHVQELEWKVGKLLLVNQALFEILSSRLAITETELTTKMNEIDLRDGKMDGKLAVDGTVCEQCGRTYSRRHNRCLYCAHINTNGSPF